MVQCAPAPTPTSSRWTPTSSTAALPRGWRTSASATPAAEGSLVDLLIDAGRPVTLPELQDLDPNLPQSSVYRNLDVLERSGLVRRILIGTEHARFELSEPLLGHHHHLICVECGLIEDVRFDDDFEQRVDAALGRAAEEASFVPLHHNLDLHGQCAECADGSAE